MRTIELMGLELAVISAEETIRHVIDEMTVGRGGWICTANVDILRQWYRSPEVRAIVAGTDLVVADGMPLVWASRIQGTPLPERVAGSTLTMTLTAAAAEIGASVFLLGGNAGAADAAADTLVELNPGLKIAGTFCPPHGFESDPDTIERIEEAVVAADPSIVFVGLGFPKQERLIAELRELVPSAWFIGCGVSLSFLAGEIHRAPEVVQQLGFEWLHRMCQEPKRLSKRYLVNGVPFLLELMTVAAVGRMRRPAGPRYGLLAPSDAESLLVDGSPRE